MHKLHCLTCDDTVIVSGPEDEATQLFANKHREHDVEINGMSPAVFFDNIHTIQALTFEALQPLSDAFNKIAAEYTAALKRKEEGE